MAKNREKKVEQVKKTVNRKSTLKSAPNSLKKIRKLVDEFIESGRELTPADKLDMRMTKMFLEYLSESIDNLLSGKVIVNDKNEDYNINSSETDDDDDDDE